TGSLGQGFSVAVGRAMANQLSENTNRVYTLLGDGEIQEGQIWEAAMAGAHYKCDNLCAIVDNNNLQIDGKITDVMSPYPIKEKFEAFGWNVIEIDGHNYEEIEKGFADAKACKGKPTLLLATTVKGKGVSFMENQAGWHGVAPTAEQCATALEELAG
ncbi:MAG: 1-deoxy-D-xylulose-5-phosphate synthase N-terminal domain-containing protein, partial [Erysipelotrichaceae bacterium]